MMENLENNIIGKWDVTLVTPFGESLAQAEIKNDQPLFSGTIIGEHGSTNFSNGILKENLFTFSTKVEVPIKATISAEVQVNNNKFFGTLMIDEYMKININGEKNVNI